MSDTLADFHKLSGTVGQSTRRTSDPGAAKASGPTATSDDNVVRSRFLQLA
jgi:hypothetical protein